MLSTDRLSIYLDELKERRDKLFADGTLPPRKMKLFNAGGAQLMSTSVVVDARQEMIQMEQKPVESVNSTTNDEESAFSNIDEQHEHEHELDRLVRQKLLAKRNASVQKRQQNDAGNKFRSKSSRKFTRIQAKDQKFTKATIKFSERAGLSISANFSTVENGEDLCEFLVSVLSEEAQQQVKEGTLTLVLECRDPAPSKKSGRVENVLMSTTSMSSVCKTINTTSAADETSSLLEWNVVPRGRVWLNVYETDEASGGRKKTNMQTHLASHLRSCFSTTCMHTS